MSDEIESEWLKVSFGVKITGAEPNFPETRDDRRALLRGLATAVAYLLLPEADYAGVKVYASDLTITESYLFTDDMLNDAISKWGEEDQP